MTVFAGADRLGRATPAPAEAEAPGLAGMTVAQLRELCSERGLKAPSKATKTQLLALLGK